MTNDAMDQRSRKRGAITRKSYLLATQLLRRLERMNGRQLKDVCDRVDQEGFDYCFCSYSDFPEIKDDEFHALRTAYVKAAEALKEYLGID